MSLSDHLDDIMGDTVSTDDIGLESLVVKRATMDVVRNNSSTRTQVKLDKNFSKKLNVLYDTIRVKAAIENLEVVDYSMALEAIAGMGDAVTLLAKLTKTPSRNNKALLVSELESTTDILPTEYMERVNEINELYEETRETRNNLVDSLKGLADSFLKEIDRLSSIPPMVIHEGESINLYTSPLLKICSIDDTKLMYDKYNGKLVRQLKELFSGDSIPSLLQLRSSKDYDPSVSVEAEQTVDLEVTEEEEDIASKLADKLDNEKETTIVTEDDKSSPVEASLVVAEETLECLAKAIYNNISMLSISVKEIENHAGMISSLNTSLHHNLETNSSSLLTDEVHSVISGIPLVHKQLTHVLAVSDLLVEAGNPVENFLKLLQFLD